jgi:leader peptidase (prepilin peptidase)/N-methyltransferase
VTAPNSAAVAVTVLIVILVGSALGSYAGVVASRGWRASLRGRSRCDTCGYELVWYELVPLVSFFALQARCRTCGASIGWGPFLWEAGGAAIALAIALPVLLAAGI